MFVCSCVQRELGFLHGSEKSFSVALSSLQRSRGLPLSPTLNTNTTQLELELEQQSTAKALWAKIGTEGGEGLEAKAIVLEAFYERAMARTMIGKGKENLALWDLSVVHILDPTHVLGWGLRGLLYVGKVGRMADGGCCTYETHTYGYPLI